MRKIIIILFVLIAVISSGCGNYSGKNNIQSGFQLSDTGTVKIAFKEYEYNFGKVTEGEKIAHLFTFENKGTANLVLTSVETSCGCTVPKFNKKPVVPGGNGNLEVFFNTSGRNGMQTKTITVKSNASSPVVLLKITAEVVNNNK
jgi:hypothetical protein